MRRITMILFLSISIRYTSALAQGSKHKDRQSDTKPNIILMMDDQHQAEALSIADNTGLVPDILPYHVPVKSREPVLLRNIQLFRFSNRVIYLKLR